MSICTYFSLYFIIQELLFEGNKGIVCTVVVQIQWVQHIPESDTVLYNAAVNTQTLNILRYSLRPLTTIYRSETNSYPNLRS